MGKLSNKVNDPDYFRKNSWCQGGIIDDESAITTLLKNSCGYIPSDSPLPDFLIIISQDCDILHYKIDDEPYIDFIAGRFGEKKDGSLFYGKNPRKIQIEHDKGIISFIVHDILRVTKSVFETINPKHASMVLDKNDIKQIVYWISKRYARAAFPDEFIKRLKNSKHPIEKISKNEIMEQVVLIYIDISDEELNADQIYKVTMIIGVQHGLKQENMTQIEDIFYKSFNTPGIEARINVLDIYDITYDIIENYKRFDLDYRSMSGNYETAIPVAGIDTV
jgi:uncharacterized protein (UPF0297 family)